MEPPAGAAAAAPRLLTTRVSAAPPVSAVTTLSRAPAASALVAYGEGGASGASGPLAQALAAGVMTTNLRADELWAPAAGPRDPHARRVFPTDAQHTIIGALQTEAMDAASFDAQFHAFNTRGVAADPTGSGGLVSNAMAPLARSVRAHRGDSAAAAPAPTHSWTPALGVGASMGRLPAGMTLKVQKRERERGGDVVANVSHRLEKGGDVYVEGRRLELDGGRQCERTAAAQIAPYDAASCALGCCFRAFYCPHALHSHLTCHTSASSAARLVEGAVGGVRGRGRREGAAAAAGRADGGAEEAVSAPSTEPQTEALLTP